MRVATQLKMTAEDEERVKKIRSLFKNDSFTPHLLRMGGVCESELKAKEFILRLRNHRGLAVVQEIPELWARLLPPVKTKSPAAQR